MRKTKFYCQGCHKPKKMKFRQKNSVLSPLPDLKETSIKALPKIVSERTSSIKNLINKSVANSGRAKNFEILEMYSTNQEFTLH